MAKEYLIGRFMQIDFILSLFDPVLESCGS